MDLKTLIGYKVLYNRSMFSPLGLNGMVEYKINEWVSPNKDCGPLCVFNNIQDAINFMGESFDSFRIYECLYEPSEEKHIYFGLKEIGKSLYRLPKGTVLASRVKLISMY